MDTDAHYLLDKFDPLTGDGPENHNTHSKIIIRRAKKILKNRTREEISHINKVSAYIINEHYSGSDDSNSEALLMCTEKYILDDEETPNLKWSEVFSVQALLFISILLSAEQRVLITEENIDKISLQSYFFDSIACTLMLEAMESIGYAKMFEALEKKELEDKESIEKITQNKISLKSRKAAIAKHAKSSSLKKEFIDFYLSDDFPSKSRAADIFLCQLDADKSKILKTSNAKRTLTDALSKHLKSMNKY